MKITPIKPAQIVVSVEAYCATERNCYLGKNTSREANKIWIETHELYLLGQVPFTPVRTITNKLYWMHCYSGSLYDNEGKCKSGELSIKLCNLRRAQDEAAEILSGIAQFQYR